MKRLPFEPPTEHYNDRIESIDEQICALLKQRKDLSDNDPGFPTKELISAWAKKYHFYEDFLNSVFSHLLHEEMYRPVEDPVGFVKHLTILKSFEKDDVFYLVPFVRQYENASVVHLNIDRERHDEFSEIHQKHTYFDLSIEEEGKEYNCRMDRGGGSGGHMSYTYIVSPPLPDDLSGLNFVFKEYHAPLKPTGFEIVI
jgi:hypothetical protein